MQVIGKCDNNGPKKLINPLRAGEVCSCHDFTVLDYLVPHPVCGCMSWVQILDPTAACFDEFFSLIREAYLQALGMFEKKGKAGLK